MVYPKKNPSKFESEYNKILTSPYRYSSMKYFIKNFGVTKKWENYSYFKTVFLPTIIDKITPFIFYRCYSFQKFCMHPFIFKRLLIPQIAHHSQIFLFIHLHNISLQIQSCINNLSSNNYK